jgi:S-formylglutathione hydrolase FrmB
MSSRTYNVNYYYIIPKVWQSLYVSLLHENSEGNNYTRDENPLQSRGISGVSKGGTGVLVLVA